MLSTAHANQMQTTELESDATSAKELRLLRKLFFKTYIKQNRSIRPEELTACLLYFALAYIEQSIGLACITKSDALKKKTFKGLTDNELSLLGNDLMGLLQTLLPDNLCFVMTQPDSAAWHNAKALFSQRLSSTFFSNLSNLGFCYQIFSLGMQKTHALQAVQKANKTISREELIAFTKLYTPDWVVDFLVANTCLSAKKLDGIPWRYSKWLIPGKNEFGDEQNISDLRVLDPACGAGQFLFSSFDLLMARYKQIGCNENTAAGLILKNNLFGADIDEKALWVSGLGLLSKCLRHTKAIPKGSFNLYWLGGDSLPANVAADSFLGSIDRRLPSEHPLKQLFQVIITNPPYIGRKCLSRQLRAALKEQYPDSTADLAAAFVQFCCERLSKNGRLGVITQSSLLSIPSYQELRHSLFTKHFMQAVVCCGPGVFPLAGGEKIDSVLLLLQAIKTNHKKDSDRVIAIDLTKEKKKDEKLREIINGIADGVGSHTSFSVIEHDELINGGSVGSGLSAAFLKKIECLPKLNDIAEIKQGMATTNNAKFVRYSFDVDADLLGLTWLPYIKGSGSEKFSSANPFVVNWGNNGQAIKEAVAKAYPYLKGKTAWVVKNEQYYFKPGLCFSLINKTELAVRRLPAGCIFDVASSAIFAKSEDEDFLLAYLNSMIASILVKNINRTINIQVGDLKKLPIFPFDSQMKSKLAELGRNAYREKEKLLLLRMVDVSNLQDEVLSSRQSFKLAMSKHLEHQSETLRRLSSLQSDIDNEIIKSLERMQFIDSIEAQNLFSHKTDLMRDKQKSRWLFDEQTYIYKALTGLVAKRVSANNGDRIVVVEKVSSQAFADLFAISNEVVNFWQQILQTSLERIFCQNTITDLNKLAQEPSRYFSIYKPEQDICLFLSGASLRNKNKCEADLPAVLRPVLTNLSNIEDWTSRDLFDELKSIF